MKVLIKSLLCAASTAVLLNQDCFAVKDGETEEIHHSSPAVRPDAREDLRDLFLRNNFTLIPSAEELAPTKEEAAILKTKAIRQDFSLRVFQIHLKCALEDEDQFWGPEAQLKMSSYYKDGVADRSIQADLRRSFVWCYAAALRDHEPALYQLARKFAKGEGVDENLGVSNLLINRAYEIALNRQKGDLIEGGSAFASHLWNESERGYEVDNSNPVSSLSKDPKYKRNIKGKQKLTFDRTPEEVRKPRIRQKDLLENNTSTAHLKAFPSFEDSANSATQNSVHGEFSSISPQRKVRDYGSLGDLSYSSGATDTDGSSSSTGPSKNSSFGDLKGAVQGLWSTATSGAGKVQGAAQELWERFPSLHSSSAASDKGTPEPSFPRNFSSGDLQGMSWLRDKFSASTPATDVSVTEADSDRNLSSRNSSVGDCQQIGKETPPSFWGKVSPAVSVGFARAGQVQAAAKNLGLKFSNAILSHSSRDKSTATSVAAKPIPVSVVPMSVINNVRGGPLPQERCVTPPNLKEGGGTVFSSPSKKKSPGSGSPKATLKGSPEEHTEIRISGGTRVVPTPLAGEHSSLSTMDGQGIGSNPLTHSSSNPSQIGAPMEGSLFDNGNNG